MDLTVVDTSKIVEISTTVAMGTIVTNMTQVGRMAVMQHKSQKHLLTSSMTRAGITSLLSGEDLAMLITGTLISKREDIGLEEEITVEMVGLVEVIGMSHQEKSTTIITTMNILIHAPNAMDIQIMDEVKAIIMVQIVIGSDLRSVVS